MPLYMTQFAYTPEAWAALTSNPEDRAQVLSRLAESFGARIENFYYSFGDYDGLYIFEAPDETTAAAIILTNVGAGHIKEIKTIPLMTVQEAMEAMRKAGSASIRVPGASNS